MAPLQIESQHDNVVSLSVNTAESRSLECCSILALTPAQADAHLSSMSHICSIGAKSGDFDGHSMTFTLFWQFRLVYTSQVSAHFGIVSRSILRPVAGIGLSTIM